jgi:hypothetical protein
MHEGRVSGRDGSRCGRAQIAKENAGSYKAASGVASLAERVERRYPIQL